MTEDVEKEKIRALSRYEITKGERRKRVANLIATASIVIGTYKL